METSSQFLNLHFCALKSPPSKSSMSITFSVRRKKCVIFPCLPLLQTPHIGQVALYFGANDMGSVMMEENVVSAAGTTYCLGEPLICHLIRSAGFLPAQRDNSYDLLRVHDAPDAPDLAVDDWSTVRTRRLHVHTEERGADDVELSIGSSDEGVLASPRRTTESTEKRRT